MKDNKPKISILTPSYNCAPYIRECIESVLAQNYDNFEQIVADGASKDGTVEILKSYPHLKWISEPDNGEGEALNRALKLATGDIIVWLNADDYFEKGALEEVIRVIDPDRGAHIAYGKARFVDEAGVFLWEKRPRRKIDLPYLLRWWNHRRLPHQPSLFFTRQVINEIGPFKQELHYSLDYDLWLRMAQKYEFHYIDKVLSAARTRQESKSIDNTAEQLASHKRVNAPYIAQLTAPQMLAYRVSYFINELNEIVNRFRRFLQIRTRLKRLGNRVSGQSDSV